MNVAWEAIQQVNELADGSTRQRILGYRLKATLEWGDGWIRDEDLTGLASVANDASATITFKPRPNSKPAASYAVIWANKMDFTFHGGNIGTYRGIIELVGNDPTATVGTIP